MKKTNRKDILAEGRFLRFVVENGWEYAERKNLNGIVTLVAVTPEGNLLLVEQFRTAVGGPVIELPAGLSGDVAGGEGEALEAAAARELEEETGYRAARFVFLTEGPAASGATNESVSFFRAFDLERVGEGGGEGDERILVHEVPLPKVEEWLEEARARGAQVDPKVYAGLFFVRDPIE